MSHLDEGTLHALLDGELASSEMMEIEAHLDGCSACSARLRAAREFLEESDRLVGSVQFGRFSAAPAAAGPAPQRHEKVAAAAPAPPHSRPQTPPPPTPPPREHHKWEEPEEPVLLIPDNPEASPLLSRWPRLLGWAAALTFTVSAGFLINNLAHESSSPAATPAAAGTVATVSQQELDPGTRATPGSRRDSSAVTPTAVADARQPTAPAPADKQLASKGAPADQPKSSLSKDSALDEREAIALAPAKSKAKPDEPEAGE
jgi:anti-sigma factor RsiW